MRHSTDSQNPMQDPSEPIKEPVVQDTKAQRVEELIQADEISAALELLHPALAEKVLSKQK